MTCKYGGIWYGTRRRPVNWAIDLFRGVSAGRGRPREAARYWTRRIVFASAQCFSSP